MDTAMLRVLRQLPRKMRIISPVRHDRGAEIGLVMAWSQERETAVLKAFLDLVRVYQNWPGIKARRAMP